MNYFIAKHEQKAKNKNKIGLPPNKCYCLTTLARHKTRIDLGIAIIMIGRIEKTHLVLPMFSRKFSLWQEKVIKKAKFNGTKVLKIKLGRNWFLLWPFILHNKLIIISILLAKSHETLFKRKT